MRTSALVVLLMAVPAAGSLTFDEPLAATGADIVINGSWALLWFGREDDVTGQFSSQDGGTWSTWVQSEMQVRAADFALGGLGQPDGSRTGEGHFGALEATFSKRDVIGGLFVHAEDIQLTIHHGSLLATRNEANECLIPYRKIHSQTHVVMMEMRCPGIAGIRAETAHSAVSMVATNVETLEGIGFETRCMVFCPGLGAYENSTAGNDGVRIESRNYTFGRLESSLTNFSLEGRATGVAMISGEARIAIQGTARLPAASGRPCPESHCELDADQTLMIRGNFSLDDLAPSGSNHRMAAQLNGDVLAIQVDNEFFSMNTAIKGGVAVGILAVVVGATKILVGVLQTSTRRDVRDHPNRRLLYDYILAHPGATFRELLRGTGIPAGTARHHLAVLRSGKMIQEHGHKATLRYFENHGRFDSSWNSVVLLREPELKRLHAWLMGNPGAMQGAVVEAAGAWGWSRSTTQHRLSRLVDEGLVDVRFQGRRNLYTARKRAPVPLA